MSARVGWGMSDSIQLSSVAVNCPDATELAKFYADITGGRISYSHPDWATVVSPGGRIDFQTVADFQAPRWPAQSGLVHIDFLVDDLSAAEVRVVAAATKYDAQPNAEH